MMTKPPCLSAPLAPCVDLESWPQIRAAFAAGQAVEARQAWRPEPEEGFRPMRVKTVWTPAALYVRALIEDADIFNPETRFNEPSFVRGDVFEMFLRPGGQESYYEFHVTPANQRFQLRIPSARALAAPRPKPGIPAEWLVSREIRSRMHVDAAGECWEVMAEIPFDLVCEAVRPMAGSRWTFSFSRYDYTRGQARPVLSSTSPHAALNFHRQEEWGTLLFLG